MWHQMTFDPISDKCRMCESTLIYYIKDHCPSPLNIRHCMWIQWPLFQNLKPKGQWSLHDLWLHFCWGHICATLPWIIVANSMEIHHSIYGYSDHFSKTLTKRSMTTHDPRWPLTSLDLLRSHVWLYPRITVSMCPIEKHQCTLTIFKSFNH